MIFKNETHAEHWAEAVEAAGVVRDDDTVSGYYGASLFIITGIPGLYGRVKQHIERGTKSMTLELGKEIAMALDVQIDKLLEEESSF